MEMMATVLQTGLEHGMHSMDSSLHDLYDTGIIDYYTAASKVQDLKSFRKLNGKQ